MAPAVSLQVSLNLLVGQEAVQLRVKGEIREHHHLFGQVGSVERRHDDFKFLKNADTCECNSSSSSPKYNQADMICLVLINVPSLRHVTHLRSLYMLL